MKVIKIGEKRKKRTIIETCCNSIFLKEIISSDSFEETFSKIDRFAHFFAAYDGPDVLGYIAIYINDTETKTAFISMIGVTEEKQRKSVGRTLMRKCEEEALAAGMTCIRLEVQKANINAIHFYEHMGFEYEKEGPVDSMFLIKQLN